MHSVTIGQLQHRIAMDEDIKAYRELYDFFFDGLFRFSYAIVRCNETAEEIVSDVFLKIWEVRKRLPEIDNLKVYLYTTARNYAVHHLQQNTDAIITGVEDVNVDAQIELGTAESLCVTHATLHRMRYAISILPAISRLIFQLIKEEHFNYKETATVLHISPVTVRHQFAYAVRKIGEAIPSYWQTAIPNIRSFSAS